MSDTDVRCGQCGAPVQAGQLFCSRCGVDVSGVHPTDAATLEVTAVGGPAPPLQSTMRQMLREATTGEYEILSELGRGGMATVFLGHDISLDRRVAIKVMAPHLLEGEGMAERFKLEARTAAQLSHPHIIPIYAVKETASTLFFVMKYVEGKPLDEIIKKMGQLPIPMVKDILTKVGSALGYAHRRGVVHRDVKPGNIMIDEEGTPIVTDFGIAKVAETKGLTMTGTTIGTPAYMSPEQCEAKPVTGASDQYSLGVVAWEMLTGRTPFAGDSAVTTMYKHCHEALPPLEDFRPDGPPEILETVTRMLAKDPAARWPSLEAAIRKLGSSTQDQLDPIRRELLELARDTDPRELVAQLSTPRSPMPGVTRARTDPDAAVTTAAPAAPRRRGVVVAAAAVVVIGGSALAVLRPWEAGGTNGGVDPRAAPIPAATSPDQAATGDGGASTGNPTGPAGGADGAGLPAAGAPGGVPQANPDGGAGRPAGQPQPVAVTSVRVGGVAGSLEPGDAIALDATALGAGGTVLRAGAPRWSSSDPAVGTVTADGTFTAVAPGTVTVTATIDGVRGSTSVTVAQAGVATLDVMPTSVSLAPGERATLVAQARTGRGEPLSSAVTWRSDAPGVATVSAGGEVQGVTPGSATITAAAGGASTAVGVTVTAPVVSTRAAIEELVAAYARALESGDINAVRRSYPGMTPQQEQQLSQSIRFIERANLRITSLQDGGDTATAQVEGTYDFVTDGRRTSTPVSFRATFERVGAAWQMTRTQ